MLCSKAINNGLKLFNIPDESDIFDLMYNKYSDAICIFNSGQKIVFSGKDYIAVGNLRRMPDSKMRISSYEDQIELANYTELDGIIKYCEEKGIRLDEVQFTPRFKRIDRYLAEHKKSIVCKDLCRNMKYMITNINGFYSLKIFGIYTCKKLED